MANVAQVARLTQNIQEWNHWRKAHGEAEVDLSLADLSNIDLSLAHLRGANLRSADLSESNLTRALLNGADLFFAILTRARLNGADLSEAHMDHADLAGADLSSAHLSRADLTLAHFNDADLTGADLRYADLRGADLTGAKLNRADLTGAKFSYTYLTGVDFSKARLAWTTFNDVNLREVLNLDTVQFGGPCSIGIDTLYRSGGAIPESFLRGCGVPQLMTGYARSLVNRPIDYYATLISYAEADKACAQQLYADLQGVGVRCWYAPEAAKGDDLRPDHVDDSMHIYDKLILLLSQDSMASTWAGREVQIALDKEAQYKRQGIKQSVLFPITLDNSLSSPDAPWWAPVLRTEHHILDFSQWRQHDIYQAVFRRLLRDLEAV